MGREADAVRTGCITGGAECVTCFEHEGGTVGMTCESGPGLHSPRRVESLARASPHLQFDTQLRVSPSSLNDQVADWLIKHEHLFSHMKHGKWSGEHSLMMGRMDSTTSGLISSQACSDIRRTKKWRLWG